VAGLGEARTEAIGRLSVNGGFFGLESHGLARRRGWQSSGVRGGPAFLLATAICYAQNHFLQ